MNPPKVKALSAALYHAGLERPRVRPQVDLCPYAFLGTWIACIFHPDCFKRPEPRRIVVENDPREFDVREGLILPAGIQ